MNPYLSICMGIGGNLTEDLLDRLNDSVNNIGILADTFALNAEIVIVEWNTEPIEHDDVIPVIKTPVRIIHAGQIHATYPNPHGLNYFEMPAKNIGIRRARGEFILSTNPDDLFSSEMFDFFSRHLLQKSYFYRANRHDTKDGKVYRVCYETGCSAPADLDHRMQHPGASKPGGLHFNASGDFLLMHRDHWFEMHGNPERDFNHTLDGEAVYLAHLHGWKQIILPHPIFHPDHERTLNLNAKGEFVGPSDWDDRNPRATENGEDWGFAGVGFEETIL